MKKLIEQTKLKELANKILTSTSKLDSEELVLRRKVSSYFFEGCLQRTKEFQLRISAIIRLLSIPSLEYRLVFLMGAPIKETNNEINSSKISLNIFIV